MPAPVQTRAEVLSVIAAHRQELAALGVSEVWLFGTAARDELRPDCASVLFAISW